jgi:hypothetical protein
MSGLRIWGREKSGHAQDGIEIFWITVLRTRLKRKEKLKSGASAHNTCTIMEQHSIMVHLSRMLARIPFH